MDYKLDNLNLNLNEKNKKLFTEIIKNEKLENLEEINIDTFKMYSDFLQEKEGIIEIINQLVYFTLSIIGSVIKTDNINTLEEALNFKNRVIMILENYQEQPGLLDPILPLIIPKIMDNSVRIIEFLLNNQNHYEVTIMLKALYQIIYILSKVRGYQTIIKFFSSEVYVFETVITYLLTINLNDSENWIMIYVLILWTSILGLVPFDVDTIDSNGTIIKGLFLCYKQSVCNGNIRHISAYALSKFITRPDMIKKGLVDEFINYAVYTLRNSELNSNVFVNLGLLASLCEIFKNGLPIEMIKYSDFVIKSILLYEFPSHISNSGIVRKFLAKLTQRIGICMLKPRNQNWRYKIALRSLLNYESKDENMNEENDELEYEIDFDNLETLIGLLLTYLTDKEYIVRWSAAKGVGRLCERLTKSMVDEIFQNIFKMFEDEENEYSWQGGCLCIAELFKRGMILPEKIEQVIPILEKALIFEINKGAFCSGSIVRDAACYVVWAMARAYTSDIMKPFVERLSRTLILIILFDKESNCRRAASAAFQEHVGRQGFFPHGIEIITETDYFAVGNRTNCYLNISAFISQYEVYYDKIIEYLCFNRLQHVEEQIRQLSAESIGLLVPFKPNFFKDIIIPKLINYCYSNIIYVRHGAITGLGYIIVGLSGNWDFEFKARIIKNKIEGLTMMEESIYRKKFDLAYNKIKYVNNIDCEFSDVINLIQNLYEKKLYHGKGSEFMRRSVNNLIRLICISNIKLSDEIISFYFNVLMDNLKHNKDDIQMEAIESLKCLSNYFNNKSKIPVDDILNSAINDESIYVTKGFTMAIPYLGSYILSIQYDNIIKTLFTNCKIKSTPNNDYQTRKAAIESISVFAIKTMNSEEIDKIFTYLLDGLTDYEIDKKLGDVGAEVRKASIKGLTELMLTYENKDINVVKKYSIPYISGLLKQLSEKMNKIRIVAGESLQKFFTKVDDIGIPEYDILKTTFSTDIKYDEIGNITNISWLEPSYSFKKIVHLILLKEYSFSLFEGLIISIGGITEDVQRCSLHAIDEILNQKNLENKLVEYIFSHISVIFEKSEKDNRVIEPLYNTLSHLLTKNCFISNKYIHYADIIHKSIVKENTDSNIHKILASVDIFYNLLFFEPEDKFNIYKRSLKSIIFLLTHKFPVVRKKAAEKLFIYISTIEDPISLSLEFDDIDNLSLILCDTNWADSVLQLRESRSIIAKILKIDLK